MIEFIFGILFGVYVLYMNIERIKDSYKIAYYETKLKNRGIDISHVENITLSEILKG